MDFASHTNEITADMQHAATLPFDELCGYMANYGAKLRRMAADYDHPDIAYRHLAHHADTAYDQATADN